MAAKSSTFDTEHPYDASFSCGMLTIDGRRFTAFMDDSSPVTVDDVIVAEMIPSVNGTFTVAKKPAFARITITVVAGTDDEKVLRSKFASCTIQARQIEPVKIEVSNGHGSRFVFDSCYCLGSTPAFSVNSNGKIQGMRYVFGARAAHNK